MKSRMPVFEEYLAGSMLANAPGWMAIALLSYIYEVIIIPDIILQVSIPASYFLGGVEGSYLVARRAYRDHKRIGIEVGFSAFLINLVFTALLFGGLTLPLMVMSLAGLVIGGIVGGKYAQRKWKNNLFSPNQKRI